MKQDVHGLTTLLKSVVRANGSLLEAAWASACDNIYGKTTRSYLRTFGIRSAFDIDKTVSTVAVVSVEGILKVRMSLVLNGIKARIAHNKNRKLLNDRQADQIRSGEPNYKTGMLPTQKMFGKPGDFRGRRTSYLLEYLAAGATKSGYGRIIYRRLGSPSFGTKDIERDPETPMLTMRRFCERLGVKANGLSASEVFSGSIEINLKVTFDPNTNTDGVINKILREFYEKVKQLNG